MGAYNFTPSEVLFELCPQAYAADCKSFQDHAFEMLDEVSPEEASEGNA